MTNLSRIVVAATLGDNSSTGAPNNVQALADALHAATPGSLLNLGDPYFNSAAMHQAFKQKVEVVAASSSPPALLASLVVEPPHLIPHGFVINEPNIWITTPTSGGGGVIYAISGTSWFLGIRFK